LPPPPPPSLLSRFLPKNRVFAEYGSVALAFHLSCDAVVFISIYLAVQNGVDVKSYLDAFLDYFGITLPESWRRNLNGAGGAFLIAFAINKVLSPFRIGLTAAATPIIVRMLRKRGFMLPK
jgi:hypothetical protein